MWNPIQWTALVYIASLDGKLESKIYILLKTLLFFKNMFLLLFTIKISLYIHTNLCIITKHEDCSAFYKEFYYIPVNDTPFQVVICGKYKNLNKIIKI